METNIVGIFTEALTANVEVVLADQSSSVSADTAIQDVMLTIDKAFPMADSMASFQIAHSPNIPLTRAFAIVLGTRVPDVAVGHVE